VLGTFSLNLVGEALNELKIYIAGTLHDGVVISARDHMEFFAARGAMNL